jgi:hypothetical protein
MARTASDHSNPFTITMKASRRHAERRKAAIVHIVTINYRAATNARPCEWTRRISAI